MEKPIWFETGWIRARSLFRTLIRAAGIGLVFLGIWNMFGAPILEMATVAPYRQFGIVYVGQTSGYFLGDVLIMALGASIAWFV